MLKSTVRVYVLPFEDGRTDAADPHMVGTIEATVADMTGDTILLEEEPSGLLTEAFKREFPASGITVTDDKKDADYILSGRIEKFWLTIGSRDRIEISAALSITGRDGDVIWSGRLGESNERFAGVMGNTRKSVADYISAALSRAILRSIKEFGPILGAREKVRQKGGKAPDVEKGPGRMVVTTVPDRTKVYIDGIYYGLTPLSLDLEPGVYELLLKLKGYMEQRERVGIRPGHTTELDVKMEKE